MFIFLFVCMLLNASYSAKITPKFCINCKHFLDSGYKSEYGKCSLFPIDNLKFLVSGCESTVDYAYCSTVRHYDNMCGRDGLKYKPKSKSQIQKKILKYKKNTEIQE